MAVRVNARPGAKKVARYPRLGGGLSRAQRVAALLMLLIGVGLVYIYIAYLRSSDVSPDSFYGYMFAIAGTLVLLLVGAGYTLRKRLRRNWAGLLHVALAWHVMGGLLALTLILMHAAGNFHPRTGSYALYGLIALVVSGIIGRALDRIAPRVAAKAALRTLTPDGEERLESLVAALDRKWRFRREDRPQAPKASEPRKTGAPWDLAYYDLGADPNEIPALLNQQGEAGHKREAPDLTVDGVSRGAMASESAAIRRAIGTERLFLHLVRVWRYLHTALSVITLGLILWHLEYAAVLLIGAR
ncbi:MAG TPA: hypothetical protein VFQ25_05195 [Ktedonobacterales bacterium]|nr:hypothetical protein [Ktedonobacterales bacterium]